MDISALNILIALLVILLGGGGLIFLQIYLSKRENRFLGLILPLLSLLYSVIMVCNLMVTESMSGWDIFSMVASTFLLANIPTVILIVIYFACREKIRRRKQLEKMNIQDLD